MIEPDAWLIRETTASGWRVKCGEMFKSEATAVAAAERLTNHWRKCEAFPVAAIDGSLAAILFDALSKASAHLDYCGYGDKWERECADHSRLPELVATALEAGRAAGLEEKDGA